ncbi:hypothetical protein HYH03_005385 [Edaphochlamys debaryana]|uniref:Ubiquitin-like protease family profile domain-containing protein n=1 Tax=Edaphochlamys debaryana TaxID=47281 RepID=A0A835Y5V0_9CHLO|nr:hypothetical protein HYH03_005385 [Edaphochlamys debaryana]|eukprot:KAG2496563.1 hypothetical protein HYH03_005385 [Edaphochlamys debaryana]
MATSCCAFRTLCFWRALNGSTTSTELAYGDEIVSFWFEYLDEEHVAAAAARRGPEAASARASILLLPPATTFLLMHGADMAAEVLAPLKPASRGLVLFAVNDNTDPSRAAGGSHWSLLAYHRPSNTLRHYDSSPGSGNEPNARRLAAAVGPALAGRSSPAPLLVQVGAMPRQVNGHDCGVYVLAMARALCEWWVEEAAGKAGAAAGKAEGEGPEVQVVEGEAGVEEEEARWVAREAGLGEWLTARYVRLMRAKVRELIGAKAESRGD